MEKIRTHKDLDVWKKSIDLVAEIYEITKSFPRDEIYGLTNQIRRAAGEIAYSVQKTAVSEQKTANSGRER